MTEIEVKNETIGTLNCVSADIGRINKGLKELYSRDFFNIAEIYMDKMYKLENLLKENGMTFYTGNILGAIVLYYFDQILEESYGYLDKIAENVTDFPDNYFLQYIVLLRGFKNVLLYERLCKKMQKFSLEDIDICAYEFFKSREFYNYRPDWFYKNYSDLKNVLVKLGIDYKDMDYLVEPIIEKQEKSISNLYEVAIEVTGSTNEDDIREYINTFVVNVKKQMNGRQKTHI